MSRKSAHPAAENGSCDALRYLIAHHPDRAQFVVHLGTAAGPDIESFDRAIVAEVSQQRIPAATGSCGRI
jgi:hypothetical protein